MQMRLGFSIFLFLFSLVFFVMSLKFDLLADSSKPGPGLFPITTGLLLLILTGIRCVKDLRDKRTEDGNREYTKDVWFLFVLTALFILLMSFIGAVLSMVVYIYCVLSRFNQKRHVQNVLNSIVIPALLYAMFELWLHAGLPTGFLGFM